MIAMRRVVISMMSIWMSVYLMPQAMAQDLGTFLQKRLDRLKDIDPEDDDAISKAVGDTLLECAALFEALSITQEDTKPALSKFLH